MLLIPLGIIVVWLMLSDKLAALEMIPASSSWASDRLVQRPFLNLVQSSVRAEKQGEISGVNRAISNLGARWERRWRVRC